VDGNDSTWSDEAFILELRHALRNIYDPDELKKSRLMQLLSFGEGEIPLSLQNILTSAVRELKPDSTLSSQSDAWRIYNILNSRYIQQFQQDEVARSIGLSPRQMRRLDRLALMALSEFLWSHYRKDFQAKNKPVLDPGKAGDEFDESKSDSQPNELNWLERTQAKEVISVASLVLAIKKTIEPLTRSLNIVVEYVVPEDLPDTVVKLLPLRQAVLTLLTRRLSNSHDGKILIKADYHLDYVLITIDPHGIIFDAPAPDEDVRETLRIANQLVALSGGAIEISPLLPGLGFEQITLTLPASEQVAVLIIDDNEDTLLLFQRYLAKTHYMYIGARGFEQAMEAIERTVPHIIVLDVMLPDIDGWELLERLREYPKTRERPIIICSILPQEQLALMFGAAAFIRKPITRESILTTLDELSWRLRQEAD